jgi:hypothetical protein
MEGMIMDHEWFAGLLRALGSGATRRGALGVLAGLAGIGLSGVTTRAKKAAKVTVCHYDADAESYVLINVSQNGWDNGHSKHQNDFQQSDGADCCDSSHCSHLDDRPCY